MSDGEADDDGTQPDLNVKTDDEAVPPTADEEFCGEAAVTEPREGMRFEKLDDLMKFYVEYARRLGFKTKIKGVDLKPMPADADVIGRPELLSDK